VQTCKSVKGLWVNYFGGWNGVDMFRARQSRHGFWERGYAVRHRSVTSLCGSEFALKQQILPYCVRLRSPSRSDKPENVFGIGPVCWNLVVQNSEFTLGPLGDGVETASTSQSASREKAGGLECAPRRAE